MAAVAIERERRRRQRIRSAGLLDFVPLVSPHWLRPTHLAPLVDALERASRCGNVFACASVPPRHAKTETILHAIAWHLLHHPEQTIAYVSYAATVAYSKSRLARDYARTVGVQLREDSAAVHEWRTLQGGGLLATGVGGPLTGQGASIIIVDDPHKNREEAESALERSKIRDWFSSTALTRGTPDASAIVVHTRWHPDDMIGGLLAQKDGVAWENIALPAIAEDDTADGRAPGEALWTAQWPVEALERRRIVVASEYDWVSMYQCRPRAKGATVFGDVNYYTELPTRMRISIGIDLAYSQRTQADYSVAIVLGESDGVFYVLDVVRVQTKAPDFIEILKHLQSVNAGAQTRWYTGGPEKAIADLFRLHGVFITDIAASADKFVRAQPTASAWNTGNILLPRDQPWVSDLISEVRSFTGVKDRRDDQVDALAAAYDALASAPTIFLPEVYPTLAERGF